MRIFRSEAEFDFDASVAALGTFDGVHVGHQKLIRRAIEMAGEENAVCIVCTFDRHPLSLLCPNRAPLPLMSLEERLRKMEKMGVDGVLVKAFTPEFAAIEPVEYLENLAGDLRLRGIVAGFNYSFGAGGRGNAALIQREEARLGYRAEIVEAVRDGDETVSSSLIRALLLRGETQRAQRLLELQNVR